jgi:uncharacterized protein (TIGR02246 family)
MPEESRTPELVELGRRLIEAWNRGDVEAWAGFFAPDTVWDGAQTPGTLEGVDAIRAMAEVWLGAYEELRSEVEQLQDLGGGVVFTGILQTGRPVGTTDVV